MKILYGVILMILGTINMVQGIDEMDMTAVTAFGKAFASVAEPMGLESVYVNTAGLTAIEDWAMSSSVSSYFNSLYHTMSLSVGHAWNEQFVWALHVPIRQITDIPFVDAVDGQGVQTGTFQDIYAKPALHAAWQFQPNMSLGLGMHYYHHESMGLKGKGLGFDLGLLTNISGTSFGLAIKHIGNTRIQWTDNHVQSLPMQIDIGTSMDWGSQLTVHVSAANITKKSTTNIAFDARFSDALTWFAGLHDLNGHQRFSTGARVALGDLGIDYVYGLHETLGTIHKIGLTFDY